MRHAGYLGAGLIQSPHDAAGPTGYLKIREDR
jgi:hypothetical protein